MSIYNSQNSGSIANTSVNNAADVLRTSAAVNPVSVARSNNTSVNNVNYNIDQTVRVFDSFYEYDVNVPAAEYDIVYSYFRREMTTAAAAGNFTVSLFRVAEETGIAALDLLEQFRGEDGVNLNVQLAYYLNSIRNKATLLGVGTPIQSNRYAARLIVQ